MQYEAQESINKRFDTICTFVRDKACYCYGTYVNAVLLQGNDVRGQKGWQSRGRGKVMV